MPSLLEKFQRLKESWASDCKFGKCFDHKVWIRQSKSALYLFIKKMGTIYFCTNNSPVPSQPIHKPHTDWLSRSLPQLRLTWKHIKKVIHFVHINNADNSVTLFAWNWMKFVLRIRAWLHTAPCWLSGICCGLGLLWLFEFLLGSLLWHTQDLRCVDFAVHDKHCSVLVRVLVMPENAERDFYYIFILLHAI